MNRRSLILGIAAAVIISSAIMIFAWVAERDTSSSVSRKGPAGKPVFAVQLKEKERANILVCCTEEEYEEAFEKFGNHLRAEGRPVDESLKVPGGAMVLAMADVDLAQELKPAKRALVEVLKRHSPRHIVLVSHSECLLYDTVAAWKDRLNEVTAKQRADLETARRVIGEWLPAAKVELYYAERSGNEIRFLPVEPKEQPSGGPEGGPK